MKILIYSAFPPLVNGLLGGAQRYLDTFLSEFAFHDAEITVVCPPLAGRPLVAPRPRLHIVPALRAVVETDMAEHVGPSDVHHDMLMLYRLAASANVVISIDEHFPVEVDVPVVLWLNNFSYPTETFSVFGCSWDAIVVPSDYVRRCVNWYLPQCNWWPDPPSVHVIAPGLNVPDYSALEPRACDGIPVLAFPHRADPAKGFATALAALQELLRRGYAARLLVPEPRPDLMWSHQVNYARKRRELINASALNDVVTLHPWIDAAEMPAYFNRATWTLCPSELPESFGLAVGESLVAGTPVIATPSGAVAEQVPAGYGVELIEFGDWEAMADLIMKGPDDLEVQRGQQYVTEVYSPARCAEQWLDVLRSTGKVRRRFMPTGITSEPPPWRRTLRSGRVWDDYAKRYISHEEAAR